MALSNLGDTIADWTQARLARFISNQLRTDPATIPPSLKLERLEATQKLTVTDQLELSAVAIQYLKTKLGLP